MKILWDLRLFSTNYKDRGIGKYCTEVINSIFDFNPGLEVYVWGEREKTPSILEGKSIKWIAYKKSSWKSSIFILPILSIIYKIDLIHYWVTLGPLREIGISPLLFVKSIGTVYDLGIEEWDTPWCNAVKRSYYWKFQKLFVPFISAFHTISNHTSNRIKNIIPYANRKNLEVIYLPLKKVNCKGEKREPYFISLGGAIHKNLKRVVEAFSLIKSIYPQYSLKLLGYIDKKEEGIEDVGEGISFENDMRNYIEHLKKSSGLIFCSLYEGLGIPPLEAMQYGCPLVLSSIPSLFETCNESGYFVDPYSSESIANGIKELIINNKKWEEKSFKGGIKYREVSNNAGEKCLQLYEKISGKRIEKIFRK